MSVGVTAPIVAAGAAGLAAFGEVDEALDTIITKPEQQVIKLIDFTVFQKRWFKYSFTFTNGWGSYW